MGGAEGGHPAEIKGQPTTHGAQRSSIRWKLGWKRRTEILLALHRRDRGRVQTEAEAGSIKFFNVCLLSEIRVLGQDNSTSAWKIDKEGE